MPIESVHFPARSLARAYLKKRGQEVDASVLGMRDERLSTVAHVWVIPTDPKEMKKDLIRLEELRVRELAYLICDMERVRTIIDLFMESDDVIEEQVRRHMTWYKMSLYNSILNTALTIRGRLGEAAPPVVKLPCIFPPKDA